MAHEFSASSWRASSVRATAPRGGRYAAHTHRNGLGTEPNLPVYWGGRVAPREYAALLGAAHAALAGTGVQTVAAGMPFSRSGMAADRFLQQMLRAPGGRASDVLAIHTYARTATAVGEQIDRLRSVLPPSMRTKPLFVSEFGWATSGPPAAGRTVPEAAQARLVRDTLALVVRLARTRHLTGAIYYAWQDMPIFPGGRDFWGLHTGLTELDGRAKPSLRAFAQVAAAHATP